MNKNVEMTPISIIIPVYNKARYLPALFSQIHTQTFRDFECLLIDDGSSDGSSDICDAFADRDDRVRVFHIPNGGVSNARNVGIDNVRGTYIAFLDSDDQIHPEYLENLYRCAEESGADLVISGFAKTDAEGRVLERVIPQERGLMIFSEFLPRFASEQKQTGIFGYCFSKLYRRSAVGDARFDRSLRLAEDLDFNLNLYQTIRTVWFDDHTLYDYLQEAANSAMTLQCDRVDYLAQLRINLHYRAMLTHRAVFTGTNRQIVEQQLSNYVYFVLFHTEPDSYPEQFKAVYDLYRTEKISLLPTSVKHRWLFFCLKNNAGSMARATMILYRGLRSLLKG